MYRLEETDDGAVECDAPPEAHVRVEVRVFQKLTVSAVRSVVSRHASEAGMDPSRRNDLVLAVNEIATNSVVHAGGWGVLRMWRDGDALICEVADKGRVQWAPSAPRSPQPEQVNGYGLWLADQLCERVRVRSSQRGTVVRMQMPL